MYCVKKDNFLGYFHLPGEDSFQTILLVLVFRVVFPGFELKGHTVDTEALATGVRSVIKHMAQVGIALCHTQTQTDRQTDRQTDTTQFA